MKERISFIELSFRERENEIEEINLDFPSQLKTATRRDLVANARRTVGSKVRGSYVDRLREYNETINSVFRSCVDELNERLRRSGCGLHYHNGFIQISADENIQEQIEEPFWILISDDKWKNVDIDIDMKEADDRKDNGGRDPAFYAAKDWKAQ